MPPITQFYEMTHHAQAFLPLSIYFDDEVFKCKSNMDSTGKIHLFKAILHFLVNKVSQGDLHSSDIPEIFSDSLIELRKISCRIGFLSEVLVLAQKIKELVQPESRLHVYQHVVGVMYQHTELNARTVQDVSFVAIACSGFPMEHGSQLIETIMNQTKEDRNNVLAMAATLASFVRRAVPKMKYYNTEAKQRALADEISKRIVPPADCLVCYDLVVMAKILYDVINDNITCFCNLYQRDLDSGVDGMSGDSIFLPVDFQSKLEALVEECDE
jgi:hypothetical protein